MGGLEMDSLEFTPKCVLPYQEGYVAVGVDGELQKLDKNYTPLLKYVKPFPTPIRDATISQNILIATWLDPELLLARIAAIDLTNDLQQGVNRGDLRIKRTIGNAIHPQGNLWSHVLDAEPLALTSNEQSFTFILWKKGIYNLSIDEIENWRAPPAKWEQLEKLPRANEPVALIDCMDGSVEVWSKGGGVKKIDVGSGNVINQTIVDLDGFVERVFKHEDDYLIMLNDSRLIMMRKGNILVSAKVSGPISDARFYSKNKKWYVAGWRELILISETSHVRIGIDEIAVYIDPKRSLYLCNDSKWNTFPNDEEE